MHSSRDIGDKYGSTSIYFDAWSGALTKIDVPTGQRAGNTLTTWLVELHMANLFGLPYKIFVAALGLVIAILSATGVYIWWKKRAARSKRREATPLRQRSLCGRSPAMNESSRLAAGRCM